MTSPTKLRVTLVSLSTAGLLLAGCNETNQDPDDEDTSAFVAEAQSGVVQYPGQYPTLQAAVDATPDGGKLKLGVGTVYEGFVVSGKTIEIVGKGVNASMLDGANVPGALVEVGDGGGVVLRALSLTTPNNAIASSLANGGAAHSVKIVDVQFVGVARAIDGTFDEVGVKRSAIVGSTVAGIALRDTPKSVFEAIVIDASDPACQAGLFVDNTATPLATVRVEDVSITGGAAGGLVVLGGKKVTASAVFINHASVIGLGLFGVAKAELVHVQAAHTHARADGAYGDGFYFWASKVSLEDSVSSWSARAGVLTHGCSETAQGASLRLLDSQFACAAVPMAISTTLTSGSKCAADSVVLGDDGGNACSIAGSTCGPLGVCSVTLPELSPLDGVPIKP